MTVEELSERIVNGDFLEHSDDPESTIEIQHYGVLGMKWGVRKEYVPHPKRVSNKNSSSKKATSKGKGLTSKQKKAIAVGVVAVGAALTAYGLYKSGALDNFLDLGKKSIDNVTSNSGKSIDFAPFKKKTDPTKNTIASLMSDVAMANPDRGNTNCVGCSLALELRRRGFDVSAFKDYDSDLKSTDTYSKIFKNINVQYIEGALNRKANMTKTISEISKFPDGAHGMINVDIVINGVLSAHAFSWEKVNGSVQFVDGQNGMNYTKAGVLYSGIFKRVPLDSVRFARLDDLEVDFSSEVLAKMIK